MGWERPSEEAVAALKLDRGGGDCPRLPLTCLSLPKLLFEPLSLPLGLHLTAVPSDRLASGQQWPGVGVWTSGCPAAPWKPRRQAAGLTQGPRLQEALQEFPAAEPPGSGLPDTLWPGGWVRQRPWCHFPAARL